MNRCKHAIAIWLMLSMGLLSVPFTAASDAKNNPPVVTYDKNTDRLTIKASNVKLSALLTQVARETGLEILFDPEADGNISSGIKGRPLEQGLQGLLKHRSYLFIYNKKPLTNGGKQEAGKLKTVKVLPKGKEDSSQLVALKTNRLHALRQPPPGLSIPADVLEKRRLAVERHRAETKIEREAAKAAAKPFHEEKRAQVRTHERGSGQGRLYNKKRKKSPEEKSTGWGKKKEPSE